MISFRLNTLLPFPSPPPLYYLQLYINRDIRHFYFLFTDIDSSWNVMAHGDAREGKWRGNWRLEWVASTLHTTSEPGVSSCRVHLKCDGTRWRTYGEVKGKLANGVGSQYPSHYHGTWCLQHYYRSCAQLDCQQSTELTPSTDLNGLVRFAERRNLVSARVPSHFNWPLPRLSFFCFQPVVKPTIILDKRDDYRRNWLSHLQIMPQNRIPLKSYHYRPQGRRTIGRSKKRWREQLLLWRRNGSKGPILDVYDDDLKFCSLKLHDKLRVSQSDRARPDPSCNLQIFKRCLSLRHCKEHYSANVSFIDVTSLFPPLNIWKIIKTVSLLFPDLRSPASVTWPNSHVTQKLRSYIRIIQSTIFCSKSFV